MHAHGRRILPLSISVAMLPVVLWTGAARAQDVTAAQQGQERAPSAERNREHFVLGLGAAYTPTYQGSEDYRLLPVPAIDVAWGPLFANLRNGIGIAPVNTGNLTLGVSATYMPGYRREDVPAGVGKLSLGLGARAFASFRAGGLIGTVGATKGIAGGNKGLLADAGVSYPVRVTPRLTLVPTIGATWANDRYNRRYFGISPEQSLASGLAPFRPGSGFKDASAVLTANYRLTDRLMLGVSGGVTSLLGDAKDSPLVRRETQPFGFISLAHRFGR